MGLIGLPGEAAMPLVLGNVLNIYAAIGAIVSFDFTVKGVFMMAMMLSLSDALLIESSFGSRVGVGWFMIMAIRLGLARISRFVGHIFWTGWHNLDKYCL